MLGVSQKRVVALLGALLVIGVTLACLRWRHASAPWREAAGANRSTASELEANRARLEAREQVVSKTVWAKEMLAQQCARTFEALWDALNAATNKLALLAAFPAPQIALGRWDSPQCLPHGLELRAPGESGAVLDRDQWRQRVTEFARAGWQLAQIEFRHNRFDTDDAGQHRQSAFYLCAHLANAQRNQRATLTGDLVVDWQPTEVNDPPATVKRIDARGLTLQTRHGDPPFQPILVEEIVPPHRSHSIDPLILYDLDGDGLSEIVLPAENLIYRRRDGGRYEPEPFLANPPGLVFSGVLADFDSDGAADFLCANVEGVTLFKGSPAGGFEQPGWSVWAPSTPLKNPMVVTCGDIDRDGDLDLFVGQYRVPTLGQILRPHYYDANDGYPAYLLRNDGAGRFTDATVAVGLERHRWRRTYSASFVDLDADGDLDLMVVSDFAGVDLYRNDGRGQFADVTREWLAESQGFGMAHALADFNVDGRLDFLMIGMNSPTADRLEHLGLTRPGAPGDRTMRRAMTFGNRLCLAREVGGFERTALSGLVARTGWSWGCSAADFDNDGFPDLYIANGHQTRSRVRDYEPEFWLHDLYLDETVDDVTASAYLLAKDARTRGQSWSYGGYEKNRLYLNQQGAAFVEVGHLLGVALEEDSRNVVTDDLDGDGRQDLLVTTFELWPSVKQTLRVYRNTLSAGGNWIGFRFREEGPGTSPVGVQVILQYGDRRAVRQLVTGDSFRSQHASTLHFGLGRLDRVDRAEIRWPGGRGMTLREPPVNRYHTISLRPPYIR